MTENIKNCFSHAQGNFAAVFIIQASLQKSSEPPDYYFWVDGLATFWAPRSAPLAVRRTPDDSPPQPPSPTPPLHHSTTRMSRCQSVAIEPPSRYWPGYLPCWDGPLSVRGRGGEGGHGTDGLMDGGAGKVEGWRSPRERRGGGSWSGPLGPLNWHVQAPGLSWSQRFNKTCGNTQNRLPLKEGS